MDVPDNYSCHISDMKPIFSVGETVRVIESGVFCVIERVCRIQTRRIKRVTYRVRFLNGDPDRILSEKTLSRIKGEIE